MRRSTNIDVFGDGSIEHVQRFRPRRGRRSSSSCRSRAVSRRSLRADQARHRARGARADRREGRRRLRGVLADHAGTRPARLACATLRPAARRSTLRDRRSSAASAWAAPRRSSCAANEVCGPSDPTSPLRELPRECEPKAVASWASNACKTSSAAAASATSAIRRGRGPGSEYGNCSRAQRRCVRLHVRISRRQPPRAFVCNAGAYLGAPGAACGENADCASGTCNGTRTPAMRQRRPRVRDRRGLPVRRTPEHALLYSRHPGWQLRVIHRRRIAPTARSSYAKPNACCAAARTRSMSCTRCSPISSLAGIHPWTFPTSIKRSRIAAAISFAIAARVRGCSSASTPQRRRWDACGWTTRSSASR